LSIVDATRVLQRELGAYYTPASAARIMAEWIVCREAVSVLEPSMGGGAFVEAVRDAVQGYGRSAVEVFGVEYELQTFEAAVQRGLVDAAHAIHSDFLAVPPFPVDGVIGNPPYVRLRHLPPVEASRALRVAEEAMGEPMDPSGSVWMSFVLHASQFLRVGGRMALVLPFDFTYVRYARPLWRFLGRRFERLRLVRVRQRIFADILQDVVLLFADGAGGSTATVDFEAFETSRDFVAGHEAIRAQVPLSEIVRGDRPFTHALLPPALRLLLHDKVDPHTVELGLLAKFNIGYVTGDKSFFHPQRGVAVKHALPSASLHATVTSARQLRDAGIFTSGLTSSERLFLPPAGPLTEGEARYIRKGEREKLNRRYKCRVRKPWWRVPGVLTPDLIVSVFSEEPCMLVNDAQLFASNSLLCGYVRDGTPRALVAGWFTPLTALQCELHIHALGGGVFVLVPNEISRIRVPKLSGLGLNLGSLDQAVRNGDFQAAHAWGTRFVLQKALRLSDDDVGLIEEGREILARWRRSSSEP
jgi:hypothetical protein